MPQPGRSPVHGPDGWLWWDGERWVPLRRGWWHGGGPLVGRLVAGWAAVLSVPWCLAVVVGSADSWSRLPGWLAPAVLAGFGAGVLATVALGWWVGRRRLWRAVPPLALIGTGVLAAWYVAAQLATSPPSAAGDTGDLAAGAGIALLGVPTLAAVLLLLYAGAGLGRLRAQLVRETT